MHMGRVIGTVHATRKDPNVETASLLVVQPLDALKKPHGAPIVAADMVGAGFGEIICYTTAYEAVIPWKDRRPGTPHALIDAGIVAILDRVDGPGDRS